ncbi:MAG: T9SS type A sorting domain-containing protein, partial [Bacteroidetes bacterium]
MKKNYTLSITFILLSIFSGESFCQFTYTPLDTIEYGAIGTELICSAAIINSTPNAINMRVTREQNVMADAPNWESAFCMDVCYLRTTDSVNYTFDPMDTVNFTFHFYTEFETSPDSTTAIMKWKNVNTLSNIFYQRFYGITQATFGVNDVSVHSASVSIYPMPVVSGDVFSMSVSNVKPSKNITLVVYNMFGGAVNTSNVIEGINFMNLDLSSGVYSYSLVSEGTMIHSGKIAF